MSELPSVRQAARARTGPRTPPLRSDAQLSPVAGRVGGPVSERRRNVGDPQGRSVATFALDGRDLSYEIVGGTTTGLPSVMIDHDDDLTAATTWSGEGYVVAPFLDA